MHFFCAFDFIKYDIGGGVGGGRSANEGEAGLEAEVKDGTKAEAEAQGGGGSKLRTTCYCELQGGKLIRLLS